MRRRWLVLGALTLSGCADGGDLPPSRPESSPAPARLDGARSIETTHGVCALGERPKYFVPGPAHGPLAILGCARLGVSGKRVEFSASLASLDGELHTCINPAYSGRGSDGLFIPGKCMLEPPLSRFVVRDATQPRQGVRGYAFVVWGTAGASTHVVARFAGGTARAAVFKVGRKLAREFGESPFSVFVVELPVFAGCAPVTVTGDRPGATERIPARAKVCDPTRPQAAESRGQGSLP